jgi:hypothetical protein
MSDESLELPIDMYVEENGEPGEKNTYLPQVIDNLYYIIKLYGVHLT